MAIEKITKNLKLDLSSVPKGDRARAKEDIGNFVVEEILREVSSGRSPVSGESFKKLSKDYADEFKGGNRTPNLELDGDMLDALTFKNRKDGIEVGIFRKKEVPKADGHNNFSGDSKLPRRRFIPKDEQKFKRDINSGIKQIIKEYESAPTQPARTLDSIFTIEESDTRVEIQVSDLFDDDFLESFLRDRNFI